MSPTIAVTHIFRFTNFYAVKATPFEALPSPPPTHSSLITRHSSLHMSIFAFLAQKRGFSATSVPTGASSNLPSPHPNGSTRKAEKNRSIFPCFAQNLRFPQPAISNILPPPDGRASSTKNMSTLSTFPLFAQKCGFSPRGPALPSATPTPNPQPPTLITHHSSLITSHEHLRVIRSKTRFSLPYPSAAPSICHPKAGRSVPPARLPMPAGVVRPTRNSPKKSQWLAVWLGMVTLLPLGAFQHGADAPHAGENLKRRKFS